MSLGLVNQILRIEYGRDIPLRLALGCTLRIYGHASMVA